MCSFAAESFVKELKPKERKLSQMDNQLKLFNGQVRKALYEIGQRIQDVLSRIVKWIVESIKSSPLFKSLMRIVKVRCRKKLFRDFFQEVSRVKTYRSQVLSWPVAIRARSHC